MVRGRKPNTGTSVMLDPRRWHVACSVTQRRSTGPSDSGAYNSVGMRRPLIIVLSGALLAAATVPAAARYDCKMTGARNQPVCCCKGPSSEAASHNSIRVVPHSAPTSSRSGSTDSCGCCDVTYDDDRPAGIAADRASGPGQKASASTDDLPLLVLSTLPARDCAVHTAPIRAPGVDLPPPRGVDRHVLLCTFLC